MGIYDFSITTRKGEEISMNEFKGKVLLIVNTATECGFTPQYKELQDIYDELHNKGLEILDFPCNQFGNQAPGNNEDIHTFCTGRFGIKFPQYAKIDVNGENASPLYKWITSNTKFEGFDGAARLVLAPIVKKMDKDYKNNGNIKWNFTKILVDRNGEIKARFEPTAPLEKVKKAIIELL